MVRRYVTVSVRTPALRRVTTPPPPTYGERTRVVCGFSARGLESGGACRD